MLYFWGVIPGVQFVACITVSRVVKEVKTCLHPPAQTDQLHQALGQHNKIQWTVVSAVGMTVSKEAKGDLRERSSGQCLTVSLSASQKWVFHSLGMGQVHLTIYKKPSCTQIDK